MNLQTLPLLQRRAVKKDPQAQPIWLSSDWLTRFAASDVVELHTQNAQRSKLKQAVDSLTALEALQHQPELTDADQAVLNSVRQLFSNVQSVPFRVSASEKIDILNVYSLRTQPRHVRELALGELIRALQARLSATVYQPRLVTVGAAAYRVHNPWVDLKSHYSAEDIDQLLQQLTDKGVFRTITHPETGLIQTSETVNDHMLRQWHTDSVMNGMLQKHADPQSWQRNLIVLAATFNTPVARAAIEQAVADPDWYRKGKLTHGVFHIFVPESVHWPEDKAVPHVDEIQLDDTWLNNQRLESQALVLNALVSNLKAGVVSDSQQSRPAWSFPSTFYQDSGPFAIVLNAIVDLSRFLMAVNTDPNTGHFDFEAQSSSSWEEIPFAGGMTSDTADTILAFEQLYDLMFNPAYHQNVDVQAIRQQVWQHPRGQWLKDEQRLQQLLAVGRAKIHQRVVLPIQQKQLAQQNPQRPADTSMSLLGASDYRFNPDNLLDDARIRITLLQQMQEALGGEDGMRRYNEFLFDGHLTHDSYLNSSFYMLTPLREALYQKQQVWSDHNTPDYWESDLIKHRQSLTTAEHAAQWCLGVSATLQGLAKAKIDVLTWMQHHPQADLQDAKMLLTTINQALPDSINRNLALIAASQTPGQVTYQADGMPLPDNSVMEAYEIVRDLFNRDVRLPGSHVLLWGAAQLFDGLNKAKVAQAMEVTITT